MTAQRARRRVLADDGIIDPIAVELAARGTRPVALTRAERQLAAARILARGGTPYLISKRLYVSGTTAHLLAARCQARDVMTRGLMLAENGNRVIAAGPVSKDQTAGAIRDESRERGWTLPGHTREMSYRQFRGRIPSCLPGRPTPH